MQFRRPPQSQPLDKRVPNIILRRIQSLERALGFGLVALHMDKHTRRAGIVRHNHGVDAGQPDAGIGQFTLKDGLDLLANRSAQSLPMMSDTPSLQALPSMKENRLG